MPFNIEDILGQPAIYQILNKKRGRSEEEKKKLAAKVESSCMRFNNNRGRLTVDEFYNVIKLQNGIEVTKDEIRLLVADLDMDRHYKVSIKVMIVDFSSENNIFRQITFRHYDRGRFAENQKKQPFPTRTTFFTKVV